MSMSKIEKIRNELKRRLKYTHDWLRGDEKRHSNQAFVSKNYYKMKGDERTLDALLSFLDTLEEPDKNLEEAAEGYAREKQEHHIDFDGDEYLDYGPRYDAFIAGATWQEKRNEETIKTAEDHAFLAGADWQKEQMLKEAVEGEAEELYNDGESQCTVGVGTYFKPGERVYVLNAMEGKE